MKNHPTGRDSGTARHDRRLLEIAQLVNIGPVPSAASRLLPVFCPGDRLAPATPPNTTVRLAPVTSHNAF